MAQSHEPKAQNEQQMFQEMIPFLLYAALPLLFTIAIAFTFGHVY